MNKNKGNEKDTILVWYLGNKGAGSLLFEKILKLISLGNVSVLKFDKFLLWSICPSTKKMPFVRFLYFIRFVRRYYIGKIISKYKDTNVKVILIIMSSPLDIDIKRYLPSNIQVVRLIHDSSRHEGDLWPTNRTIKKMLTNGTPLALSEFVAQELFWRYGIKVQPTIHPLLLEKSQSRNTDLEIGNKYLLIIGRQRKYQNTRSVIKLWVEDLKNLEELQGVRLVVAGNIDWFTYMRWRDSERILFIRRWLTDEEFVSLIQRSTAVLCFYRSATQSGVISACQALGIPFVATNVGGIPEQATFGGGIIVETSKTDSWIRGVKEVMTENVPPVSTEIDKVFRKALLKKLEECRH